MGEEEIVHMRSTVMTVFQGTCLSLFFLASAQGWCPDPAPSFNASEPECQVAPGHSSCEVTNPGELCCSTATPGKLQCMKPASRVAQTCCTKCSATCAARDCNETELELTGACNCGGDFVSHNNSWSTPCREMCWMNSFCRTCDMSC